MGGLYRSVPTLFRTKPSGPWTTWSFHDVKEQDGGRLLVRTWEGYTANVGQRADERANLVNAQGESEAMGAAT